jgi:predicted DNA-binding transcriptional regulator YafY
MLRAVTRQSFRAAKTGDVSAIHGGSARQPIYRILRIHELLKDGKFPNCQDLSHDFEVSYKTVQRDIDFMRDQLQLPIEYDSTRHGFIYTRELNQVPAVAFKEGEARKVRILLDPLAASLASEGRCHNSQKLKFRKDGSAELTLNANLAPDLEAWILSWGSRAKVIAPTALRNRIAAILQKAARQY